MPLLTLLELTCGLGRAVVCACRGGPAGKGPCVPAGTWLQGPALPSLCLQMSLRKGDGKGGGIGFWGLKCFEWGEGDPGGEKEILGGSR